MCVDEVVSFLRKELVMNIDKCWGDGGKRFIFDLICMLMLSIYR